MPHRLSLNRRVGELRRTYTGETDTTLWPTIVDGMSALTAAERATIYDTLECGFETRLLGENVSPPVPQHVRRAVLADTIDTAQQQLEAALLFALGKIGPYLWPATPPVAPMPVCSIVRPGMDGTPDSGQSILHLLPSTAAPMCAMLLPRVVDGTVHGLAGLRVRLHRRHVRLHLADNARPVSVALAGTTLRQWSAMLAFAAAVTGHEWSPDFADPLTGQERAVIAAGRVPGPVAVASALFRRLRVLGDTMWLAIRPDGAAGIRVEWAGGRTAAQVAAALVHPVAGLPGDRFIVARSSGESVTVTAWGMASESAATVVLCQAPVTATPPFTRIDAKDAWAEFGRVMTIPNSSLIHAVADA